MVLRSLLVWLTLGIGFNIHCQTTYLTETDLPYYPEQDRNADAYLAERCVLDLYFPKDKLAFSTVVWFHGGGLKAGRKVIPEALQDKGMAVVAVNYRLYPKNQSPCLY